MTEEQEMAESLREDFAKSADEKMKVLLALALG